MKLVSWNVNGLRSVLGKGLLDFVAREKPDVLCLQEVKAHPGDVQHIEWPSGYTLHLFPAEKRGYSGTGVLTRVAPLALETGIGEEIGDAEGRVQTLEFGEFFLVNCYTPNAQRELTRLEYRVKVWDPVFRRHVAELAKRKPVVFCGDMNCAHTEDDIARPKQNDGNSGFTRDERENFSKLLGAGFLDTWRVFHPTGNGHYSWWTYRAGARAKNIGWRIDYFGVSASLKPRLREAFIRPEVTGSDHCPVGIVLD
jgi:exodeoxyribonuclease III